MIKGHLRYQLRHESIVCAADWTRTNSSWFSVKRNNLIYDSRIITWLSSLGNYSRVTEGLPESKSFYTLKSSHLTFSFSAGHVGTAPTWYSAWQADGHSMHPRSPFCRECLNWTALGSPKLPVLPSHSILVVAGLEGFEPPTNFSVFLPVNSRLR